MKIVRKGKSELESKRKRNGLHGIDCNIEQGVGSN